MKFTADITAEDKADFLEAIYDGFNRKEAAELLDSTGTAFRRLCRPGSEHYDAAFADAYNTAIHSEEHADAFLERIRGFQQQQMEKGDSTMVQKMSLVYDPAWAPLRHQNLNVNVQMLARILPGISTAELERAYAELEPKKPRAVIEAA